MTYKRHPVSAPRLRGLPLRLFVETLESPLGRSVLQKITSDSGLERFRQTPAGCPPVQLPLPRPASEPGPAADPLQLAEQAVAAATPLENGPTSAADFARAYRERTASPLQVAEKVIAAISERQQMGWFIASLPADIRAQAQASAERFEQGRPLSVLDGVPLAVKDELDKTPYPTTVGTSFLGTSAALEDATVVARLRAAGALLVGKANMHEVGINPIGLNPHHGAARNPWDRSRITGGSSSGSAAAVAGGICPISLGADGGGSIRIPASLCGVVGLKATWGRISEAGVFPLCWHVGHVGPIGATVSDAAAAYALIAGEDPLDTSSLGQPKVELRAMERQDLKGLRLGIHRPYFEDADPDVVRRSQEAVSALVAAGATVVEIPAPDLNVLLWSHAIIILSEMHSTLATYQKEHRDKHGLDVRTNLAIARFFSSTDYVHALRHRRAVTLQLLETLREVDAIVTPTTATTAPSIPEAALPLGESNLQMTDALMRFIRAGNLTGMPAVSVPAGYDRLGLPVGLHLMGRPWEEGLLLRLALEVERSVPRRVPPGYVRPLGG